MGNLCGIGDCGPFNPIACFSKLQKTVSTRVHLDNKGQKMFSGMLQSIFCEDNNIRKKEEKLMILFYELLRAVWKIKFPATTHPFFVLKKLPHKTIGMAVYWQVNVI